MNFNSIEFLFFFLPVFLLAFHGVPARWRLMVLAIGSCIFYAVSGLVPLAFMLLCIAWGWACALLKLPRTKLSYAIAITPPLLILFLFKYLAFSLDTFRIPHSGVGFLGWVFAIALPAGISFYTFKIVSYSVDVLDGKVEPEPSLLKLIAFFTAFPQLIAGPILRYGDMRAQMDRLATSERISADFATGLKFLSVGLFGKIFFADILAAFVKGKFGVDTNYSSLDALFYLLSYSFRIYYDFWAYSIMAIGLGMMIGLDIPRNFIEPYLSASPREFWRRWHVTLSFWLRDYVYLRLGGNKNYIRNIAIVFLVCGLWHGAGLNFIVWGAYHGVLVIGYHLCSKWWDRMPKFVRIAATFTLVSLGWPLFAVGMEGYIHLLDQLFLQTNFSSTDFTRFQWAYLLAVGLVTFFVREERWLFNAEHSRFVDWPVVHASLVGTSVLFLTYRDTFIYFRF